MELSGVVHYSDAGKKHFLFCFWVVISRLPFTLELIHDDAKWSIRELIHDVWLSIRLKNLIPGHKTLIEQKWPSLKKKEI